MHIVKSLLAKSEEVKDLALELLHFKGIITSTHLTDALE